MVLASGDMSNSSVALRNAIKIETLVDPVTPVEAILKRCPKQQMMLQVILLGNIWLDIVISTGNGKLLEIT